MQYSFQQGLLNMPPKRDPDRRLLLLPINEIRESPNRARIGFRRAPLSELMISIAQVGLIQPITVRQTLDGYELIAGARRLKACKLLGFREIPCVVVCADDEKSAAMALTENVQREPLEPLEEAQGIQTLAETFRLNDEQLSMRLGKGRTYLNNRLKLLQHVERCAPSVRRAPQPGVCRTAPVEPPPDPPMRIRRVPKDCRLFVNSVKSCIEQLDGTGIAATLEETRLEDGFDLVIHVRT